MKFIKDVVKPGRFLLLDGRVVEYTAADVRHLKQRADEMVKAGLNIPIAWGHQPGAVPMTDEEALKAQVFGTLGHADTAVIEPGDVLALGLDVPDPDDARRFPSIKYVSPQIRKNWRDGRGKLWPGLSITHVAVTGNPVNPDQQPFRKVAESAPVQMARDMDMVQLSFDNLIGGRAMDKEKELKDDKEEKPSKEAPSEEETEIEEETEAPADCGTVMDVVDALRETGMVIPEEVSTLKELAIAIKSNKPADDTIPPGPADRPKPVEDTGPVLMALDASNPRDARIIKLEREALVNRVRKLVTEGKVSSIVANALKADVLAADLALDARGGLSAGDALVKLKAYEALEPRPWIRDGTPSVVAHPQDQDSQDEETRAMARATATKYSTTASGS